MRAVFCSVALLLFSLTAFAQSLHPQINLLSIRGIKTVEQQGDELYLTVTVYPSKGKSKHYHLPRKPQHWRSNNLKKVTKVPVWEGSLPESEAVTVIISLMEKDLPPWNTDDLIGSVRVHLRNNKGKLESNWSIPNRVDGPVSTMSQWGRTERFELLGEDGQYHLYFMLKNTKKG